VTSSITAVGFDGFYKPTNELELGTKAMNLSVIEPQLQQIHGLAEAIVIIDPLGTVGEAPQAI
jgi:hypothetical protein